MADPTIGGHNLDLLASAGSLAEAADYVVSLIGHLGYDRASPIV
jgi:hypothetical protein